MKQNKERVERESKEEVSSDGEMWIWKKRMAQAIGLTISQFNKGIKDLGRLITYPQAFMGLGKGLSCGNGEMKETFDRWTNVT